MTQGKRDKRSVEQLLRLVEQLPAGERELLLLKLNDKSGHSAHSVNAPHHFLDWRINIDSLAEQQCVASATSVNAVKGDFWPVDDDLAEFLTTLRRWRCVNEQ